LPVGGTGQFRSENNPLAYLEAIKYLLTRRPAVLIASLWRSCAVLLVIKLVRPKTKAVTFLHLASDVHWPDKVLNRMAMQFSTEIWADSKTTLEARVPKALRGRARVISFLVARRTEPQYALPDTRFLFWGRLHPQKGLVRALRIFAGVQAVLPKATFHLIGPDGGARVELETEVKRLGLDGNVFLLGPMAQADIFDFARSCSFYLQTSVDEGMAMAVIEAMQLGLVPVVTPVGEIRRYCHDSENAIVVTAEVDAVKRVIALIGDKARYQRMSRAAFATWQDQPLYRDDVVAACTRLVRLPT
jgi:glycogen synthase